MNATRNGKNHYIGNFFVMPISEEEYNGLKELKSEYHLGGDRYIIYMNAFPQKIKARYAKRILLSQAARGNTVWELTKEITDLRHKLNMAENSLGAIQELEQETALPNGWQQITIDIQGW